MTASAAASTRCAWPSSSRIAGASGTCGDFLLERFTHARGGHGRDERKSGRRGREPGGRGDEGCRRGARLRPGGCPGSSATTVASRVDAEPRRARLRGRPPAESRSARGWPTNTAAHAVPRVELGLEGQQAQHQVAGLADGAHPPLPPRPHLRADVLHGRGSRRASVARARPRLNSGAVDADEHVRARGPEALAARAPRRRSRRGRCRSTSVRPMTASSSAAAQASHPAAIIFGPATPKHCTSGTRARRAAIRAAPSWSPEGSPATMPTRSGSPRRAAPRPRRSSHQAAGRGVDEVDEGTDLGVLLRPEAASCADASASFSSER